MQFGSENEVVRARLLAVGAFIAVSLPLVLVAPPPQPEANQSQTQVSPQSPAVGAPEVKPATLKAEPVRAPRKRKRIVVSISERRLAVVEEKKVVKSYPIAVGASESPSPTGEFRIVNKLTDPTYYSPGMIVSPGPANPLGSRWLGLDKEHYGIHGTNDPASIGQAASQGCIRMAPSDVEELFAQARIGDSVAISHEPLELLAQLDEVENRAALHKTTKGDQKWRP
jgi:lipoprotein-anchoring transpeptidase ErfK/SrfK